LEEQGQRPAITDLMLESQGPDGLFAIFSEDEGAGYFYVYKPETQEVLAQICIYESGHEIHPDESDVQVMWSADLKKCGVVLWGKMRGVIDIACMREAGIQLTGRDGPSITDTEELAGFSDYFDERQFIQARQTYWKDMVAEHDLVKQSHSEKQPSFETNFILHAMGPSSWFAVFEDDHETGYLYLFLSRNKGVVVQHLHLYDCSERLQVIREDVRVRWSTLGDKCGVSIWDKIRGVIDVVKRREGRVWLQDRSTPGIADEEWLNGF